jgi:hypothetical protein
VGSIDDAKPVLKALAGDAEELIHAQRMTAEAVRGFNIFFDTESQHSITALPHFAEAVAALAGFSNVEQKFTYVDRTVLRFVCSVLKQIFANDGLKVAFERTWSSLLEELRNPKAIFVAASPLVNIQIPSDQIDLDEGVSIRHQHFAAIAEELNRAAQTMREFFGAFGGLSLSPYSQGFYRRGTRRKRWPACGGA